MLTAKISEIFYSLQGEGKYVGTPQVFVRFFECHMHCVWCDTPASIGDTTRHFKEMTLREVFAAIDSLWQNCHAVSLTGGEPLLQALFIQQLAPLLKKAAMPLYLETSGVLFSELKRVIDDIDIIAMDLKLPSSTKCRPYWQEHEEFLKISRAKEIFIKIVISSETKKEDIVQAVDLIAGIDPEILLILQPNTYDLKNGVLHLCQEFQQYCLFYLPHTRILPQVHKFLKIP